jgi:ATP-binding protein involved in chromosome partitioning
MLTTAELQKILSTVEEPELRRDIVSLNMVKSTRIDGASVFVTVELTTPACPLKDELKNRVVTAIQSAHPGTHVEVDFTSRVLNAKPVQAKAPIPGVKHIVAVYACKGGVGKSTVSTNLACSLALRGASVGLLDADIHGPNIPLMMGGVGRAQVSDDNKITPIVAHRVKTMSLEYVMDSNAPKIWRGPMVHGAVQQLLRDTQWGELDYLIIDLPPGTGDAQLTVVQSVPLSGVVIVTTPQAVSLLDGARGIGMFQKLNVPLLGLVENMSGFECPHCQTVTNIFSKGGGEKEAARLRMPFLGAIPLDPMIVSGGDTGQPVSVSRPDSSTARLFMSIAERVAANISLSQFELEPASRS